MEAEAFVFASFSLVSYKKSQLEIENKTKAMLYTNWKMLVLVKENDKVKNRLVQHRNQTTQTNTVESKAQSNMIYIYSASPYNFLLGHQGARKGGVWERPTYGMGWVPVPFLFSVCVWQGRVDGFCFVSLHILDSFDGYVKGIETSLDRVSVS